MFRIIVFLLVFVCSCKPVRQELQSKTVVFSKFPDSSKVTFQNFISTGDSKIARLYIRDTTIIAYDWRAKGGYFFYAYGLNSKLNFKKYVRFGSGKGKAQGAISVGLFKDQLWVYDLISRKLLFQNLKLGMFSASSVKFKEFPIVQHFYNIQILDDQNIIGNGDYKTPNKLQEINLYSGKATADYGLFKGIPKGIPFYSWKRAQESFMALSPSTDRVVLVNRFSDQIEIFDRSSRESITVKGPENFVVEFTPFKDGRNVDMMQRNDKTRFGFTEISVTDNFIYALFSGYNENSGNAEFGKTLYIYDWEGTPIKKLTFDRLVSSIAVSDDDKTLYAYDPVSQSIVITKI
ncbi:MAG: BF3164 family lipoprotein [Bacteroidota bacterium]